MSLQIARSEQSLDQTSLRTSAAQEQNNSIKVLIPYDGSESAEAAFGDLKKAGLQELNALVAVTDVWMPLSPYEITRAVNARRMLVLTAGASSFTPALRSYEEQRVLSLEAERRIGSMFPSATVRAETMQDTAAVIHEILRKAKQWGAELIIVGSKSSPSPHITDYAGPAIKVAREAECSVRIARRSDRKDDSPIRILVGVDGSDSVNHTVEAVASRFWPKGSQARIVAVRKSGPRDPSKDSETNLWLDQAAEELRTKGLTVAIAIRNGKAEEVILQEARELTADCIFIDAYLSDESREGYRPGLGKVAEALALGAHSSVEIVRARDFSDRYLKPAA